MTIIVVSLLVVFVCLTGALVVARRFAPQTETVIVEGVKVGEVSWPSNTEGPKYVISAGTAFIDGKMVTFEASEKVAGVHHIPAQKED